MGVPVDEILGGAHLDEGGQSAVQVQRVHGGSRVGGGDLDRIEGPLGGAGSGTVAKRAWLDGFGFSVQRPAETVGQER